MDSLRPSHGLYKLHFAKVADILRQTSQEEDLKTPKGLISVQFSIGHVATYASVMVILAVGLAFGYSKASPDIRSVITYGSSLFGAMIALCTVIYTAQNLRQGNEEKLSAASSKFIERWNSPSYFDIKTQWREIHEALEKRSPQERAVDINSDLKKRTVVVEIFNFYEEMAVAINLGSVDEEVLKRFFRTIVLRYWYDYEFWVGQHRVNRQAPRFATELEEVARKWK